MALHDEDTGRGASLEAVLAELKRGKTVPCYLLYGEEEFRLKDALDKIIAALIPDAGDRELNLFVTDSEHEEIGSLCESLITPPLLPGRKVVVVRDTCLFQSKNVLSPLIARIRERLESEPARAAGDFMRFLAVTGMQLDDLREGGWRRIDDDTWQKIVPDDDGQGRETWLPKAVELCAGLGAVAPRVKTEEETERLEQALAGGMPEGNHLILTAVAVDRRKKLFKAISSLGRILTFVAVKGEARQQQVVMDMAAGLLAGRGKRLSAGAWTALGQKTGFSLRESLGAIEKLIAYSGEKAAIEAADVEAVIGRTKEDSVFDLTGAISGRNRTAALRTLKDLLEQGSPPLMIFSMIVREIRFLLQAKLLLASGRLGAFGAAMDYGRFQKAVYPALKQAAAGEEQVDLVSQHPFVIFQSLKNTGRFTRAELAGYIEMLAGIDLALKSTGQDARLLLERFLLTVCRTPS